MIDISHKFTTLRYAKAVGSLRASPAAIELVRTNRVPKGDVFQVARAAGINAAKRTSDWIVFCHSMPLDWAEVSCELDEDRVLVSAEVKSIWKTGVEMEALTAVTAALLNIYDMLKPVDEAIEISEIKLSEKRGGKSDFTDAFKQSLSAGVLVVSDSAAAGDRQDRSGKVVETFLQKQPVELNRLEIVADEVDAIREKLEDWVDREKLDLIFTVGGTGLGPRDVTPQATRAVVDEEIPGVTEAIRAHGRARLPYAMLSRGICGLRQQSLIVNLPGSPKGAQEGLEALFPGLLHVFPILQGGGHD